MMESETTTRRRRWLQAGHNAFVPIVWLNIDPSGYRRPFTGPPEKPRIGWTMATPASITGLSVFALAGPGVGETCEVRVGYYNGAVQYSATLVLANPNQVAFVNTWAEGLYPVPQNGYVWIEVRGVGGTTTAYLQCVAEVTI